ncbi:hypothetical protein ABE10_10850, partial [Bacillus toyonensis]|nr:hypothetical protein [Bacillus toyonensis]
ALGASHVAGQAAERLVGQVGPGAGGVHDHVGGEGELLARDDIAQPYRLAVMTDRLDVVEGAGTRVRGAPVLQDVQGEALWVMHGGVVVGRGVLDLRIERGKRGERFATTVEAVTRDGAAVAGEGVVDRQAHFDEEGAALLGLARLVGQEPEGSGEDPRERGIDRDRGLERLDVVRGDLQETVALLHRLLHQTELAVLEIADAAVDHMTGRRRCAGGEVPALDEDDVDPLQGEIAERGDAVDASADHHNGGPSCSACLADLGTFGGGSDSVAHPRFLSPPSMAAVVSRGQHPASPADCASTLHECARIARKEASDGLQR